jgi:ABC-type antimicrobial peptide transport system permease subunit
VTSFGRPRLSFRDAASESVAGLLARPGRSFLTVLGTVLGVGALVATLGVSKTAGNQIVGRFDELAATSVVARPQSSGFGTSRALVNLPWDAAERLARLNGVVAAGTSAEVDVRGDLVRSVPVNDPLGQTEFQMTIVAASPGLVDAVRGEVGTGRWFDAGHSDRADAVAVLGIGAAQRLNITRVDQQPAIFIGDTSFAVIGILATP